tara:strand:+ start:2359 stop:3084 length:726 start_codon:yes stop_codon:yes gene_type:complete
MDTKEVKEFFNSSVSGRVNKYEYDRWFKNAQARASYASTKEAVEKYVLPLVGNDSKVFELGPGPGTWTKLMLDKAPEATYDLVDISQSMLDQARAALPEQSNITLVCSDVLDLKAEQKYNLFFSSRMIEYVPDKNRVVEIISQSLASGGGGCLITKTPQGDRPFKRHNYTEVHKGQIATKDLVSLLEANGLQVKKYFHVTCVFPLVRSGFLDRVTSIVCRLLPFSVGRYFSEAYGVVFEKK